MTTTRRDKMTREKQVLNPLGMTEEEFDRELKIYTEVDMNKRYVQDALVEDYEERMHRILEAKWKNE
jgi:hypothetical protein